MKKDVPPHRYDGLQDFLETLERRGRLKRIARPVALKHEITEIHRRVLAKGGPALMFEKPVDDAGRISSIPLVTNLFGTRERIEWGFGLAEGGIGELATLLSELISRFVMNHGCASSQHRLGGCRTTRRRLLCRVGLKWHQEAT